MNPDKIKRLFGEIKSKLRALEEELLEDEEIDDDEEDEDEDEDEEEE